MMARVSVGLTRVNVDGSPRRSGSSKTVSELGAPSMRSTENPNSRLGVAARIAKDAAHATFPFRPH